jgi:hypothetical protein
MTGFVTEITEFGESSQRTDNCSVSSVWTRFDWLKALNRPKGSVLSVPKIPSIRMRCSAVGTPSLVLSCVSCVSW